MSIRNPLVEPVVQMRERQQAAIRELVEALKDARDVIIGVSKKSDDLVLFKVNNLITKHEVKDAE